MKKRYKKIFLFLLTGVVLIPVLPLRVSAAEQELTKNITVTGESKQEYQEQAEKAFPEEIKGEDGKSYKLENITYKVTNTKYLDKKEKIIEGTKEPEEVVIENGEEYTLIKSEQSEKIVAEKAEQTVTAYDEYDYAVSRADVSATKRITAKNDVTGENESVICQFTDITQAGTRTVSNVITITFRNYDAAYYEWNGNYIPRNDDTPQLTGYEEQLLSSAGAAEGSTITGITWNGEPYEADGVLCRDAAATVEQQIQVYRANYKGEIITPEKKETVYKATYEAPDQAGAVEYEVQATATYLPVKSIVPYILTGVGLAVLAIVTILILFILSKKRKEKEICSN